MPSPSRLRRPLLSSRRLNAKATASPVVPDGGRAASAIANNFPVKHENRSAKPGGFYLRILQPVVTAVSKSDGSMFWLSLACSLSWSSSPSHHDTTTQATPLPQRL